jgi:hypothetical protein
MLLPRHRHTCSTLVADPDVPKNTIRQWLRAIGAEQQQLTKELESSQTGLLATALAGRCCSKTARVELRHLYSNLLPGPETLAELRDRATARLRPASHAPSSKSSAGSAPHTSKS